MNFKLAIAASLIATTAFATRASAAVNITSISGNPGFEAGIISYVPTGLNTTAGIGRFELTGTNTADASAVDYFTYCIDIFHYLHTGSFTVAPLSTLVSNVTKRDQLAALVTTADPFIVAATTLAQKKDISTAIQLAVWEITNESGTSGYSLSGGLFQETGSGSANARALAATYLSNVADGTWGIAPNKQVEILYDANNQSQIFVASVPEASSWAMLIVGLGLVGVTIRRRKSGGARVTA